MSYIIRPDFYNSFRVLEIAILLGMCWYAIFKKNIYINRFEIAFFLFILMGVFFWRNFFFIVTDLLLFYLLYKSFFILKNNNAFIKIVLLFSLFIFLLLPISVIDYIKSNQYYSIWYPLPWNIRIYNSYFLVTSILATWFYITENKYNAIYLLYLFLAFFTILLDAGRSATLAYSVFALTVILLCHKKRLSLVLCYSTSWVVYLIVIYLARLNNSNVGTTDLPIARTTTSLRYDLWLNAFECWSQSPIIGCGFYQLDSHTYLAAHPHNIFIQILSETGLIGFGFLAYVIYKIARSISWNIKENYFVLAALAAVTIDMSLSGVHIYPITQMALLLLFVFLLKNVEFIHSKKFIHINIDLSNTRRTLLLVVYIAITVWFLYLSVSAFNFSEDISITPPRFWLYGYQLY